MAAALIDGAITGPTQPSNSATRPRRGPTAGNRRRPFPSDAAGSRAGANRSMAATDLSPSAANRPANGLPSRAAPSARRKRPIVGQHAGEHRTDHAIGKGARISSLDTAAGVVDQVHVMHARGAGGHAGEAGQAAVDMLDDVGGRRAVVLQHVLDQVDAPARRIELVAEQDIGRAGRGAETAMHAGAKDPIGFRGIRVGELGEGKGGLHRSNLVIPGKLFGVPAHQTPAHIRPGLSTPLGSKLALTRFVNAPTAAILRREHADRRARRGRRADQRGMPAGRGAGVADERRAGIVRCSSASQTRPPAQS